MTVISTEAVMEAVTAAYPGTVVATNWGERAVFYNPGCALPKGVYCSPSSSRVARMTRRCA